MRLKWGAILMISITSCFRIISWVILGFFSSWFPLILVIQSYSCVSFLFSTHFCEHWALNIPSNGPGRYSWPGRFLERVGKLTKVIGIGSTWSWRHSIVVTSAVMVDCILRVSVKSISSSQTKNENWKNHHFDKSNLVWNIKMFNADR